MRQRGEQQPWRDGRTVERREWLNMFIIADAFG
jgi:hypothetical protein